jgi:hypothetical protein
MEGARCVSSSSAQLPPKPTFSIQTNPVSDYLQLQNSEGLIMVEIINLNGRRLLSIKDNLHAAINTNQLPKGS